MKVDSKIHNLKRPPIERMLRIHHILKQDTYPNCSVLSRGMEVSSKTINRDIEFMRDRMSLPIEYDRSKHGYHYTENVESLPTIDISEGELLALSIAQKAMDHYKGTPFEKPLTNALNKITASLPDTVTANLSQLSESISFKQSSHAQIDDNLLQTFTKAVLERRELEFNYKKLGARANGKRRFHPYHLTNHLGKWYAIGLDANKNALRTFLLTRASMATLTNTRFTIPASFTPDEYLSGSFGIYSNTGTHHVVIRFLPPTSEHISENTWHPSQSVKYMKDGMIELSFDLGSLNEIANWIISWGADAIALKPEKLRQMVMKTAEKVRALYK